MIRRYFFTFLLLVLVNILFGGGYFRLDSTFAQQSCPYDTLVSYTSATLVGEIIDNGGDSNIYAWFEWGETPSLGRETVRQFLIVNITPYRFCTTLANLNPCTQYYYRAAAENSGGRSYGILKSFRTLCEQASVDLKANGSDSNVRISPNQPLVLSWSSNNVSSCSAESNPYVSDWSGSKPSSGSQTIYNLSVGTYTFTLRCVGFNQTVSDSVVVEVRANPPTVVTLPPVSTL